MAFELTDFSLSGVAAKTHDLGVVANFEVAVVEASLHEDCVPVIRPLTVVAVAAQL